MCGFTKVWHGDKVGGERAGCLPGGMYLRRGCACYREIPGRSTRAVETIEGTCSRKLCSSAPRGESSPLCASEVRGRISVATILAILQQNETMPKSLPSPS